MKTSVGPGWLSPRISTAISVPSSDGTRSVGVQRRWFGSGHDMTTPRARWEHNVSGEGRQRTGAPEQGRDPPASKSTGTPDPLPHAPGGTGERTSPLRTLRAARGRPDHPGHRRAVQQRVAEQRARRPVRFRHAGRRRILGAASSAVRGGAARRGSTGRRGGGGGGRGGGGGGAGAGRAGG